MPLLHQSVAGPFAGDRQAVQLAAEADGEVADVDHLLHLAECLALDLADLDLHQPAEVGLVRSQQHGELADQLAAQRTGSGAPRLEGGRGLVDCLVDRRRSLDTAQGRAGDRGARRSRAGGRQAGCTAGTQRGIGEFGERGLARKCHVNHAATDHAIATPAMRDDRPARTSHRGPRVTEVGTTVAMVSFCATGSTGIGQADRLHPGAHGARPATTTSVRHEPSIGSPSARHAASSRSRKRRR